MKMKNQPHIVTLRDEKSPRDWRSLTAEIDQQGDLIFKGLDAGESVVRIFGYAEYEWVWTVKANDLPLLQKALGGSGSLLQDIAARFSGEKAADVVSFLIENNIPYEPWSRMGD